MLKITGGAVLVLICLPFWIVLTPPIIAVAAWAALTENRRYRRAEHHATPKAT